MAKKVKFKIETTVKVKNPVVKELHVNPAYRPRKEVDKSKTYSRKGRKKFEDPA